MCDSSGWPLSVLRLKYAFICSILIVLWGPPVFFSLYLHLGGLAGRVCGMQPSSKRGHPVSRHLVSIIRECSKLETAGGSLDEHLRAVDSRQTKAIEFYLRACALRLGKAPHGTAFFHSM